MGFSALSHVAARHWTVTLPFNKHSNVLLKILFLFKFYRTFCFIRFILNQPKLACRSIQTRLFIGDGKLKAVVTRSATPSYYECHSPTSERNFRRFTVYKKKPRPFTNKTGGANPPAQDYMHTLRFDRHFSAPPPLATKGLCQAVKHETVKKRVLTGLRGSKLGETGVKLFDFDAFSKGPHGWPNRNAEFPRFLFMHPKLRANYVRMI